MKRSKMKFPMAQIDISGVFTAVKRENLSKLGTILQSLGYFESSLDLLAIRCLFTKYQHAV